jgi:hypothetical protein
MSLSTQHRRTRLTSSALLCAGIILLSSVRAHAQISFIDGKGQANVSTITFVTGPSANDLIVACGFRSGSTTAPSLPAGYTAIDNPTGANTASMRVAYKVATGSETSVAMTNASSMGYEILRGANTSSPIGGHIQSNGTANPLSYGTITLTDTGSTSWGVACGANKTATSMGGAPTGMTQRSDGAASVDMGVFDTNATISSWSVQTVSASTSTTWRSEVVEVRAAAAAAPSFSPSSGTPPQTVTLSSSGCGSFIYWNTTGNPTTSDNHGTSVSVTVDPTTVYAKVIGCTGVPDSTVSNATYSVFSVSIIGNCHTEANATSTAVNLTGSPTTGCPTTATAGDLLVAGVKAASSLSLTSTGATCNGGRGWMPALTGGASVTNSGGFAANYWYCLVDSTATITVTGHSGASYTDLKLVDARASVGWQSYPLDRTVTNVQTSASTTLSAGTTPTQNNPRDFVVAIADNWNATQSYGSVAGWNLLSNTTGVEYAMWWTPVAPQGTSTFTTSIVSDITIGAQLGFKAVRPDACAEYSLFDFSAGTNGSNPTAATLASSMFGEPNESPQSFITVSGTALKYSTSAHHSFTAPTLCNGGAYSDAGSLGLFYDTSVGGLSTFSFHFDNYTGGTSDNGTGNTATTTSATTWLCTTLPQTATANMDWFAIYSSTSQFINTILSQSGANSLQLSLEAFTSGSPIPISTSASCGPSAGTWYQVEISFVTGGSGQLQVFDASGNQVGGTMTATATGKPAQLIVGNNLANSPTTGFGVYMDKIKICYQGSCSLMTENALTSSVFGVNKRRKLESLIN